MDKKKVKPVAVNKWKKLGYSTKVIDAVLDLVDPELADDAEDSEIQTALDKYTPFLQALQPEVDRIANAKAKAIADKAAEEQEEEDADPANEGGQKPKQPEQKGKSKTEGGEDIAAMIAKALGDVVAPLTARLASIENGNTHKTRSAVLSDRLKAAGVSQKLIDRELKNLEKFKFDKDEDFESHIEELETDLSEYQQQEVAEGFSTQTPPGASSKKPAGTVKVATKEELDKINIKF